MPIKSCWCGKIGPCSDHPPRDRAAHQRMARKVKRRDGWRCVSCGSTVDLRASHIVPVSEGGSYLAGNAVTLCAECDRRSDPYAR